MSRRSQFHHRPKQFDRELRVAEFIRFELAQLIQRKLRDPRLTDVAITVNEVTVTRDLSYADVFVSALGVEETEAQQVLLGVLQKSAGFLRTQLSKRHSMFRTPALRFRYDRVEQDARHLEEMIDHALRRDAHGA